MPKIKSVAILMNLSQPYDRQVIGGITRYLQSNPAWQVYVEENPADMIPSPSSWRGDGLIADLDDARTAGVIAHFPGRIVGIGHIPPVQREGLEISTVETDDAMIAEWAAEHLLSRHLEYFGYCGMRTHGLDRWGEIRRVAFCQFLARKGFSCSVFTGRRYAPRHWNQMQAELMKWLEELPKPVGLMACNDVRGRHLLEACRRLALRVPEDVAVIGVDNDEVMCELARPPLSSIAQNTGQIGYLAARLLSRLLSGRQRRAQHLVVPPAHLVTRQSTDLVGLGDPVLSDAIRYIQLHAREPIGVPAVVEHVNLSRSTLEARFRRVLGRTVREEIERVRLDLVRRLVTGSTLSLEQIAQRCGFRSAQYLSTVFRRVTGGPPGRLRPP